MKKKTLIWILLVVILVLVGCGSGNDSTTNNNPDTFKTSQGYEIDANELYVTFDPTLTEAERKEIVSAQGLTLEAKYTGDTYLVSLDHNADEAEMAKLQKALESNKDVKGITFKYIGKAPGVFY